MAKFPGQLYGIERVSIQSFYDAYLLSDGEGFDADLKPYATGIEVITAGDLNFISSAGFTRTIPVETGRIYPIIAKSILSTSSTMTAGKILIYKPIY